MDLALLFFTFFFLGWRIEPAATDRMRALKADIDKDRERLW